MKNTIRTVLAVIVVVWMVVMLTVYREAKGPIDSKIAVHQLDDSAVAYSAGRAAAESHLIPRLIEAVGGCALLVLLLPVGIDLWKKNRRGSTTQTPDR